MIGSVRGHQKAHRYAESPVLQLALQGWRSRLLGLLLMFAFLLLMFWAFYLQVVNRQFLQEKGESRYLREIEISALRGRITDRNGDLLAVSTPMRSIWAIPADARQMDVAQKNELAGLLQMSVREIDARLASEKGFAYLKRQLPPETAERVAALKIRGLFQEKEYRRYYPVGEMAAHIVGFTGVDERGLEGVELAFDQALTGHSGMRSVIKDRRGQIVEDVVAMKPPRDGKDVPLALDNKLQYIAHSQLKAAVAENRAKAGSAVMVDVRTGEILALANWPGYNPNQSKNRVGPQVRNRAVTDSFEPGSTLKPFIAALALEKGRYRFGSLVDCASGRLNINGAVISDSTQHGVLTVAQVIQKSSNVGVSKMALDFPAREMWEMYDALGLGQMPQLGFPGEVAGRLRAWKNWRPIEQATMSYGHGVSVSLIQLARAWTALARDGDVIPLSMLRVEPMPVRGRSIYSAQTAREVRAMLEMAVQPEGTAPQARVAGYRVAGKTGTAYKIEGNKYVKKYVASFVGFAPVSEPRLLLAVMIDEPSSGRHYGGDVAGPVFSRIMGGALRTLGIPPDAPSVQVARVEQGEEKL